MEDKEKEQSITYSSDDPYKFLKKDKSKKKPPKLTQKQIFELSAKQMKKNK